MNTKMKILQRTRFISCAPRNYHKKAENTIVATDKDGNAKSNAFRFYLSSYYTDEVISPIMNGLYKQKSPEFHKIIGQITPPVNFLGSLTIHIKQVHIKVSW